MAWVVEKRSIVLLHGVVSSRLSWWRLKQDLQDLGWQVQAVDMLGHGSRQTADAVRLTIADLARDVLAQVPERVDLLVGHSLGAIVALTLARLEPGYCTAGLSSRTLLALRGRLISATWRTTWKS
jgi:pimeloyl-ACP methyl ester carboxylesterase